jgi:type II secretory pathway pseudopilin PulG
MNRVRHAESGLSLVELIIVVMLVGIMGGAMAIILVNSWTAQNDVTTTTQATNRGQLIGQSIERAMRNAQQVNVSPDGTMLQVHTYQAGSKQCQAFWFTGGAAYMTQNSGALPPAAVNSWPNSWQSGVQAHGSTPFFTLTGNAVGYRFDISTNVAPVAFSGQAALRVLPMSGVSAPCW